MAVQTKAEKTAADNAEGGADKNIYDSVFHTIVQNLVVSL